MIKVKLILLIYKWHCRNLKIYFSTQIYQVIKQVQSIHIRTQVKMILEKINKRIKFKSIFSKLK